MLGGPGGGAALQVGVSKMRQAAPVIGWNNNLHNLGLAPLNLVAAVAALPPYISMKRRINQQFAWLGLPPPHSATIVSSDCLQH